MPSSIAEMILAQRNNDHTAILFEDSRWSYREYVGDCIALANVLNERKGEGPLHIAVLLDNVPAYLIALGAASLCGGAIVGLNPTRRGRELERDIAHSDSQFLLSEGKHAQALASLDTGIDPRRQFIADSDDWTTLLRDAEREQPPALTIVPTDPYLLIFTSGTTGDPKAAICSQARLAGVADVFPPMVGLSEQSVSYLCMPLFHSNSLMANWAPMVNVGGTIALRRKFSASGFLPDIRRFGCTFMNYVGKPLTYILATEEREDDADNPLRLAFGNEAVVHDIGRFEQRFGCVVSDNYGSTEGGISINRTPDTPPGALGLAGEGTVILDPETGDERELAVFDDSGRLQNADQAVGEIANVQTARLFEGYWRNEEANEERTHGGVFWSGDLGYKDASGFIYFGGRNYDWLRVDGENFAAAPVEALLTRHPDIAIAAVYAVPNWDVGDDVMATLLLAPGASFEALDLASFLDTQPDMGTKWWPRYLRVATEMPTTASNKIIKRELRAQGWTCADPVWFWQAGEGFKVLDEGLNHEIRSRFEARQRGELIDFSS